jgi:hypothetical protein
LAGSFPNGLQHWVTAKLALCIGHVLRETHADPAHEFTIVVELLDEYSVHQLLLGWLEDAFIPGQICSSA